MRILLLGSGGREHALAYKLTQSPLCEKLFVAPGNAGTASCGTNLNYSVNDFISIRKSCLEEKIDLLVVGPEEPLVKGIVDFLKADPGLSGLKIIGPSLPAAQLEGSKSFAKEFMSRHQIPTASYKEFTMQNFQEGVEYINQHKLPVVLKADGLAAGKGVVICENRVEALAEFELMIQRAKFGEASKKVVIEEFLDGIELSVFVLCDGNNYLILPEAKDYKRVGEGDSGPNTGGMGAISPVPFADEVFMKKVKEQIIIPTVEGLKKENMDYCGFIFFGLIKVGDDPFVIEYNCRLGDPETEVVIPRIKTDLVEILLAAAGKTLDQVHLEIDSRFACTVMAVSGGYPNEYGKGYTITGFEQISSGDNILFHAGTTFEENNIVTNGGRVLCVTSFGQSIEQAADQSLNELDKISFTGMSFRRDIGYEFIRKTVKPP